MVEVLMVIIIIFIMALMARPALKSFSPSFSLHTSAKTIRQMLVLAKSRALGDPNVHAGIYLSNTNFPDSVIAFLDDDATSLNDYQYTPGKDHLLAPALKLSRSDTLVIDPSITFNTIVFRGDGSAKTSARFYIKSKFNRCDTISVLASTGRIRLAKNR